MQNAEEPDVKLRMPEAQDEPDIAEENGPHETEFGSEEATTAAMTMRFWPPIP